MIWHLFLHAYGGVAHGPSTLWHAHRSHQPGATIDGELDILRTWNGESRASRLYLQFLHLQTREVHEIIVMRFYPPFIRALQLAEDRKCQ